MARTIVQSYGMAESVRIEKKGEQLGRKRWGNILEGGDESGQSLLLYQIDKMMEADGPFRRAGCTPEKRGSRTADSPAVEEGLRSSTPSSRPVAASSIEYSSTYQLEHEDILLTLGQ